jgi:hypothetical protein
VLFPFPLCSPHPPTIIFSWQLKKSWHFSCSYQLVHFAKWVLIPHSAANSSASLQLFPLFLPEQCDAHRDGCGRTWPQEFLPLGCMGVA